MFDKHTVSVLNDSSNAFLDREIIGKLFKYAHNSAPGPITAANMTSFGSFTSMPTLTLTGSGSGAVLSAVLKANSIAIAAPGTGYAVNDNIVLAGGTSTSAIQLSVTSIGAGGAITGVSISLAGLYTALPTNPVSQSTTTGSGTGATFNVTEWIFDHIDVTTGGSGYDNTSALVISGGGGSGAAANLVIGNTNANLTLTIDSFVNLPDVYGLFVNMGQAGTWYAPQANKTNSSFNIVLTPPSGGVIAAGSIDILLSA